MTFWLPRCVLPVICTYPRDSMPFYLNKKGLRLTTHQYLLAHGWTPDDLVQFEPQLHTFDYRFDWEGRVCPWPAQ